MLRQCRRGGNAINHSLHNITGLWNLNTRDQLRVISYAGISPSCFICE
jgi:hypothetical protein